MMQVCRTNEHIDSQDGKLVRVELDDRVEDSVVSTEWSSNEESLSG